MSLRLSLAIAAAAVAAALASPSALADSKAFSSSTCIPLNAAQTDLQYKVVGLTNNNPAMRTVICTLVRDQQAAIVDGSPTRVAPWYKMGAVPGWITCTAYHGSAVSTALTSATVSSGTLPANSQASLSIDLPSTPPGWTQIQINLVCQMSQGVTLAHIYYNDAGATD